MTLAAGTRLDSFEIVAPLGAGGMGEVYRARDVTLKRDVAIKVLPEYWSRDPERLYRFEQEAQAAAALNHPNIVSIFHVGQYDGSPYIVTELLHGETLRERLRRGPLRQREAVDVGVDIARGLAAAHDAGIVHRDLKPENIFVTKVGRVKILDFGLAKLNPKSASSDGPTASFQQQTSQGHVLGTVGYMSPEQVRGHAADARSDIFAAGTVLYEMLTGKPAFRKATSAETMSAILNEDPPSVSQLAPTVPPGLQRIVNRCLAKNPAQRLQHASDLEFALEALSDSSSGGVAAVKEQTLARKWVWVAAGVAAIAIAAAIFAWWKTPPAVPVVESVTQLTDDGEPKDSPLASDGSRIYFNEGLPGSRKIVQVSLSGGRTAFFDTKLESPQVAGLAADGSALYVYVGQEQFTPLWLLPLPAGEPRRVGNFKTLEAAIFRDGRIVFGSGKDLFLTEKDGSDPRKLISVSGTIWDISISPDEKRIAFRMAGGETSSLYEVAPDGSNLREILRNTKPVCCPAWSADGRYLLYTDLPGVDIWAIPMRTGFFQHARQPIRLTNGPLNYSGALPSLDGKHIFAVGTKARGELVRYDRNAHQFVTFLSGISATGPNFSKDGRWVVFSSYPEGNLMLKRTDTSELKQLTFPPMQAFHPVISPDGKRIAFTSREQETHVVSADGGAPQRIGTRISSNSNWSPDGNRLLVWKSTGIYSGSNLYWQIVDAQGGEVSNVPSSQNKVGMMWVTQNTLVAGNDAFTKLLIFDTKNQKWSDLLTGSFVSWAVSTDGKYLYFTTGGSAPKAQRLRFSDNQVETITDLKGLRQSVDRIWTNMPPQINVAPDGSPVFTRDIGSQEIYALAVKWP